MYKYSNKYLLEIGHVIINSYNIELEGILTIAILSHFKYIASYFALYVC